jgi:enoyl-CoA hydratase
MPSRPEESMNLRHIGVEVSGDGVAVVTLDKPPVNALGPAIREELIRAFDSLSEREDVRVVVLTARGRTFCAGADIKEKKAMSEEAGVYPATNRLIREAFYCIVECSKPVIAAVNGPAIGAGLVMLSCCDIVIAADHAVFAMPEIDVGLAGGSSFLQRVMSKGRLRRMLLTGERVSAAEMLRLGVIDECVPAAELMPTTLNLARTIAAKSPVAVRIIKQSFGTVENMSLRDGYRYEQDTIIALSRTEDAREAQAAFLEKRRPVFKGR